MHSRVQTVAGNKVKFRKNRAHDYLYDPVFMVSGAKDHHKCAVESIRITAEFKICPVFPSMFSDLPTKTRNVLAVKSFDKVPRCVDRSWGGLQRKPANRTERQVDVVGVDRHLFCRRPMVPFVHPILPAVRFPKDEPPVVQATIEPPARCYGTQTDYRDSEAQTYPWEPPYKQIVEGNLEILTLANLSWENGLPAGMHEVEIIERARMKRAWENSLPPITDDKSIEKRKRVIEMMERDEWAFREKEIQHIHDIRLKLSRVLMKENQALFSEKLRARVNSFWTTRKKGRDHVVAAIKHKANRELRKLRLKHEGVNKKYHHVNVVDEHADRKSDWYGPQMRFGDHPKRYHQAIKYPSRLIDHVKGLDVLDKMPRFLPTLDHIRTTAPRHEWELCVRETRWTEEVLRKLHNDLKSIRLRRHEGRRPLTLVRRIPQPVSPPVTPSIEGVPDWEEEGYQAAVFLQTIVKGRAIQTMMFRGRERCRELIEELKSTHALHEAGLLVRGEERFHIMSQQRMRLLEKRRENSMSELLNNMEGQTLANTLDFLSKELWRLQDERRAHAFALLAERMRHKREAAEAGRRQFEERRRREHDDMFKQIFKVHQDTVDIYLEDLILESMSWVAETEARNYVQEVAKRVDEAAQLAYDRRDCIEREELVAGLIHNFVLPEAEKQRVRTNMKARQEKYLHAAHRVIYDELDNLPTVVQEPSVEEIDTSAPPPQETSTTSDIVQMLHQLIDEAVTEERSTSTFDEKAEDLAPGRGPSGASADLSSMLKSFESQATLMSYEEPYFDSYTSEAEDGRYASEDFGEDSRSYDDNPIESLDTVVLVEEQFNTDDETNADEEENEYENEMENEMENENETQEEKVEDDVVD